MKPLRPAFTLVELLVVIAIIGILVSLLLPAVQAAREAGRSSQCRNNLKQLGLAVQNYHGVYGCLPASGIVSTPGGVFDPRSGKMFSWLILILPQLEQQPLHQQFNFNVDIFHQPATPFSVRLGFLNCPSDESRNRFFVDPNVTQGLRFAKGNYAAFASPYRLEQQHVQAGMLVAHKRATFSDVTDGLSNTVLASEVRTMAALTDQRGAWALPWNACTLLAFDMHPPYPPDTSTLALTAQTPNNWRRPNADVVYNCYAVESQARKMPCFDYSSANYLSSAPRSGHPGSVNRVYGDGSVGAWFDNIDPLVMGYRIAINDGRSLAEE
jgi:prepilin-type N-terminal cleavage/methylation domain-containing protein